MKFSVLTSALLTLSVATPLRAAADTHQTHVHGEATLNLVLDGNQLLLELVSPAANLLGFEHAPQNQAQKQQLKKTRSLLSDVDSLVALTNASCQLISANIDMPYADLKNDPPDDAHTDHGDHHGHRDDHHEKHHNAEATKHSEIQAQYHLNCDPEKPIEQLIIPLFQHFPGLEKLQVRWINGNQQGIRHLAPDNSAMILNQ